jgi:hypothetical protein
MPRHVWIPVLVALAVGCARRSPQAPGILRHDVTLIDVRLVTKVGSRENSMADDSPREVSISDTVWVYPVLKVAVGEPRRETLYLCNTTHVRRVGRDGDTLQPGWPVGRHLDIWNKIKRDISLDWFEVVPSRERFGPKEGIRFRLKPVAEQGWSLELTGQPGTRRLAVQARYGGQAVRSCYLASEASVACAPWLSVRRDTSATAWATSLVGALAYRDGSTPDQTANRISCDSRGLILYALSHNGYHFDAYNADALDSLGEPVFSGYIRRGKLYDASNRPARLALGQDIHLGDVMHFTSRRCYGMVADESPVRGWSFGGIPAGLPIVGANLTGPRVRPFHTYLRSLGSLFGKSEFTIRRYPYVPPPPPQKIRRAPQPVVHQPAIVPKARTRKAAGPQKAAKSKPAPAKTKR